MSDRDHRPLDDDHETQNEQPPDGEQYVPLREREPRAADPSVALLTVVEGNSDQLGKRVYVDDNDELVRVPGQMPTGGWLWVYKWTLTEAHKKFAETISTLPANRSPVFGVPRWRGDIDEATGLERIPFVTMGRHARADPVTQATQARRCKADLVQPLGQPGWVCLDIDTGWLTGEIGERLRNGEGLEVAYEILPELRQVRHVVRASSTSGLLNDETMEDYDVGGGGLHIWILVASNDEEILKEFHRRAMMRCWALGYATWALSKGECPRTLERGVFDATVTGGDRIIFEGKTVCEPPVAQDPRPAQVFNETAPPVPVNLLAQLCPPLRADEVKRAEAAREMDRQRSAEERARIVKPIQERQEKALIARGMKPEMAKREAVRLTSEARSGRPRLGIVLHFDDGETATLADAFADPEKYSDRPMADPYEPGYGQGKAKIYGLDTPWPVLSSFAHGHYKQRLSGYGVEDVAIAIADGVEAWKALYAARIKGTPKAIAKALAECSDTDDCEPFIEAAEFAQRTLSRNPLLGLEGDDLRAWEMEHRREEDYNRGVDETGGPEALAEKARRIDIAMVAFGKAAERQWVEKHAEPTVRKSLTGPVDEDKVKQAAALLVGGVLAGENTAEEDLAKDSITELIDGKKPRKRFWQRTIRELRRGMRSVATKAVAAERERLETLGFDVSGAKEFYPRTLRDMQLNPERGVAKTADKGGTLTDEVARLNRYFIRFVDAGTAKVIYFSVKSSMGSAFVEPVTLNEKAFIELFGTLYPSPSGDGDSVNSATVFLHGQEDRPAFSRLVVRNHSAALAPDEFNLWRGFAVKAEPGDWSFVRSVLKDVVWAGDEAGYNYFIGCLASKYQRVDAPGGSVLGLIGDPGVGRSALVDLIGAPFGPRHFFRIDNPDLLLGRFNSHFALTLMAHISEQALSQLDAATARKMLGSLPTGATATDAGHYRATAQTANQIAYIVTATDASVFPVGRDNRFFLAEFPDTLRGTADLERLQQAHADEAMVGAMLYDLLSLDLERHWAETDLELAKPPMSRVTAGQRIDSLPPLERWLVEAIKDGILIPAGVRILGNGGEREEGAVERWPTMVTSRFALDLYNRWRRDQRGIREDATQNQVARALRKVLGAEKMTARPKCAPIELRHDEAILSSDGDRPQVWSLPTLEEARRRANQYLRNS